MASRASNIATLVAVIVTLLLAGFLNTMAITNSHFVSAPFAIPILIAVFRWSSGRVALTTVAALAVAGVAEHLNTVPVDLVVLHLSAIAIIGALAVLLGTQRQATLRQAYEADVRKARLEAGYQSAASAIVDIDVDRGYLTTNPVMDALFGRHFDPSISASEIDEHLYRPNEAVTPAEDLPISRALRGETIRQEEWEILCSDNRRVPVFLSAGPVVAPDGHVGGAVIVFQDATAIKELEQLRREWTSIVAHDLRQPLAVILGYAQLLVRQPDIAVGSPSRNAADHILTSAGTLKRMIDDLLDVSRLESKRLSLTCQLVDPTSAITPMIDRLRAAIPDHAVQLYFHGTMPPVLIDVARIEQVLGNLVINAAKYGYANTDIDVNVSCRAGEVVIAVTNQGPGIASEDLPHLFTRFYRSARDRQGGVGGLGLGLYISRGIVEAHGGRIGVDSTPGQTTTFGISLPAQAESLPGSCEQRPVGSADPVAIG